MPASTTPPRFYHGTRADLRPMSWVYLTGTLDAAIWGAELAAGEGRERICVVQPTGPIVDDPNLTDKRFPGNPTQSYRSRRPLRVLGEVAGGRGIIWNARRRRASTDRRPRGCIFTHSVI